VLETKHMTAPAQRESAAAPTADNAIIDITRAGIVTGWNQAAVLLYGYQEKEIVGRRADILCPAGMRAARTKILRRVIAGGQTERYEVDRVCKDRTVITVSVIATPIIDTAGAVVGVSSVSWKVSEQQAAQDKAQALDNERRDARRVQEQTDAQRRDARDTQERIDVRAEIQRHDARDTQKRIDVRAEAQRHDARDTQERIDVQTEIQRRDARDTQHQAEAAQDSQRQDAQDFSDARRDGERRDALEQHEALFAQVRQIQRMESLGQLAGGVAHDFNNLLAVILSYATFVSRRLAAAAESSGDGSWDEARADMSHIELAVDRAAALTRQLLAFASREAIRPLALDLNQVIAGVEELLRRAIGEHIELTTSLAAGLHPILADAGKLEQVLVNLAVNARDAMPDGGTLTIATENIPAPAESADRDPRAGQEPHVQLRVSDTGTGMTADVLEHAFEPFFTTKATSRGTGLGLATVYGILTQAGADIQISSRPGNGTAFTIVLPVTDEAVADAGGRAPVSWEPRGETVLVVEDEYELREVTKRIFADAGYRVIAAADGPTAIELARSHDGPIHLLVTDIVMPRMLGTELARRMRAIKPDAGVLYMSGYAWPVLAQGPLEPDVILVEKPFSDATLLAKAGEALSASNSGPQRSPRPPPLARP
jgi:PAS domain S-box-containing protein